MTASARRSSLVLVFALACLAIAMAFGAQRATSASYHTCHLSSKEKGGQNPSTLGPTYLKVLKVKGGPSCSDGKSLVRAYYNCRTKGSKGPTDKCSGKVNGYSCSETRYANSMTSFDARVTCKKGSKAIKHTYEQFKD